MSRLVDCVIQEKRHDVIMELLRQDDNSAWIANEIEAEVTSERGQMQLEDYVYEEAGVIVHK